MPLRPPATVGTLAALALAGSMAVAAPAAPASSRTKARADAGATAAASSFQALSTRAAKARDEGRVDEAIGLYRRALAGRPSWLEGRWALATLLYDEDRFAEARDQLERLTRARPGDGQSLALLGLCLARLGENEAALHELMSARAAGIPAENVRAVASFQTALLLNRLGDPDGAFEVLKPLALDGDDRAAVIEAFGLVTLRLPKLPAEIAPEERERILLAGRGGYALARGRGPLGRMALEELVSRYPATPNVHYALGMYLLIDEPATAVEELRRELAVSPEHHVAMIQIALAELKRGRAEEALPLAEKAAALAPTVPAARLAHGRALLALGRIEPAVREMEEASHLAPTNPRLRFALAQAYDQAGRSEEAARERAEFLRLQKAAGGSVPHTGEDAASSTPDSR